MLHKFTAILFFLFLINTVSAQKYGIATTDVTIRKKASFNSEIIYELSKNDTVFVTDTSLTNWYEIEYYAYNGFVSKQDIQLFKGETKKSKKIFQKKWVKGITRIIVLILLVLVIAGNSAKLIYSIDQFLLRIRHKPQIFESFEFECIYPLPKRLTSAVLMLLFKEKSFATYIIWPLKCTAITTLLLMSVKLFFRNYPFDLATNYIEVFKDKPIATIFYALIFLGYFVITILVIVESIKKVKYLFLFRVIFILLLMLITYYITTSILLLAVIGFILMLVSTKFKEWFWYAWYNAENVPFHKKYFIYEPWQDEGKMNEK